MKVVVVENGLGMMVVGGYGGSGGGGGGQGMGLR